ncbi:MAG TPA: hypothetical protein PKC30_00905 [Saprospiraceae bacterium]|nr:hypothetical protein [Saprospiraceae bacterium]
MSKGIYVDEMCRYIVAKDQVKLGIFKKNFDPAWNLYETCQLDFMPDLNPSEAVQLYGKGKSNRWKRIPDYYTILPSF